MDLDPGIEEPTCLIIFTVPPSAMKAQYTRSILSLNLADLPAHHDHVLTACIMEYGVVAQDISRVRQ